MTELHNPQIFNELSVRERNINVADPFVNDQFEFINSEVERLSQIGTEYYTQQVVDINRKRTSDIDMGNPATSELLSTYPSFADWLSTVPTAAALHPLYEPDSSRFPSGKLIDAATAEWFKNITDARGMRSRAEVMKGLLENEAMYAVSPQKWLSLACGAAQPVFSVLEKLRLADMPLPELTLVDVDKNALALAHSYAGKHGLESQIVTKRLNVLQREGLTYKREAGAKGLAQSALLRSRGRLEFESYDAVDAVGIFEYLKRADWKYSYKGVISTSQKMAGAETFIQNAYELVKPGGILIVGNMLDTHPQLGFTLNVVQWPHIQPRSVKEMTNIMNAVGIKGEVDVCKPSDGAYAIYAIRKPA